MSQTWVPISTRSDTHSLFARYDTDAHTVEARTTAARGVVSKLLDDWFSRLKERRYPQGPDQPNRWAAAAVIELTSSLRLDFGISEHDPLSQQIAQHLTVFGTSAAERVDLIRTLSRLRPGVRDEITVGEATSELLSLAGVIAAAEYAEELLEHSTPPAALTTTPKTSSTQYSAPDPRYRSGAFVTRVHWKSL